MLACIRLLSAAGGRLGALFAAVLTLTACQTFSSDGGLDVAQTVAARELRKDIVALRTDDAVAAARDRVRQLLRRGLTADAAVQIALLNNRSLQAAYNELGIAEAIRVRQSLPPNPSISVLRVSGSIETEIERQVIASVLALATLPARMDIAADRFRQAQLSAALETLRVAHDARRSFYRAVAARQSVELLTQTESAAGTASQLAKRLGETGAMNKLDQAREQAFHAEISTQLSVAKQRAAVERERLVRVLGLWSDDIDAVLPKALPALPRRALALRDIEQQAMDRRVDLQIARIELDALAKSYGLTAATRFVNVLEAGYADRIKREKETGTRTRERGFEVSFEIPVFDFGETRRREAEESYLQSVNKLAALAVNARSEARGAYRTYRSAYDIAGRYQRDVLPLRKTISDEMMLRYGAMQIDVFSLLTDAQQRLAAHAAAVEALRDFWLASVTLSASLTGGAAPGDDTTMASVKPASASADH